MPREDVEKFVRDHAKDPVLQKEFRETPDKALGRKEYGKLTAAEKKLLGGKNALDIGEYLMDTYRASLSINIP